MGGAPILDGREGKPAGKGRKRRASVVERVNSLPVVHGVRISQRAVAAVYHSRRKRGGIVVDRVEGWPFVRSVRRSQQAVAAVYDSTPVQYFVAVFIFSNFVVNCVQAQIDPRATLYVPEFQALEDAFNLIFLVELVVNFYAHFFRPFVTGWNMFDMLVVTVGMLSVFRVELPGPFALLRMLRAFRVFRLFKRIKSLNKIMVSVVRAIPGILNSAVIMVIVMCIYAILGVQFYGNFAIDGFFINSNNVSCDSTTPRGLAYGSEYFGTFCASLFTMFQILTGDSWAEVISRGVLATSVGGKVGGALYFISFVIINGMILFNVVIAVLLDKCMATADEEEKELCDASAVESNADAFDAEHDSLAELSNAPTTPTRRFLAELNPLADLSNAPRLPRTLTRAATSNKFDGVIAEYNSIAERAELVRASQAVREVPYGRSPCGSSRPFLIPTADKTPTEASALRSLRADIGGVAAQVAAVIAAVADNQLHLDKLAASIKI